MAIQLNVLCCLVQREPARVEGNQAITLRPFRHGHLGDHVVPERNHFKQVRSFQSQQNRSHSLRVHRANAHADLCHRRGRCPFHSTKKWFIPHSPLVSKEASALVSAASERTRESGLEGAECGGGLIGRVVESELSVVVESEDQQAAFLREHQRMESSRKQGAHSLA